MYGGDSVYFMFCMPVMGIQCTNFEYQFFPLIGFAVGLSSARSGLADKFTGGGGTEDIKEDVRETELGLHEAELDGESGANIRSSQRHSPGMRMDEPE